MTRTITTITLAALALVAMFDANQSSAKFSPMPLERMVDESDAIVVGGVVYVQRDQKQTNSALASILVEEVLKNDSKQPVQVKRNVLLRMPMRARTSKDIVYQRGQQGVWFLKWDAQGGAFLAEHPDNLQPRGELVKIREQLGAEVTASENGRDPVEKYKEVDIVPLVKELREATRGIPGAKMKVADNVIIIEEGLRTYSVHTKKPDGSYSENLTRIVGPSHRGLRFRVEIVPIADLDTRFLNPVEKRELYWLELKRHWPAPDSQMLVMEFEYGANIDRRRVSDLQSPVMRFAQTLRTRQNLPGLNRPRPNVALPGAETRF